jgi:L-ascorbate metabolism protein UlaG (beta-lactamase superfamily)
MDFRGVQMTWLGHGTYTVTTQDGKQILIDPWVDGNPAFPKDKIQLGKLDAMLITHAHGDHVGDAVAVAQRSQPDQVVAIFELAGWLDSKGVQNTIGMNKGGSVDVQGVRVTMVHAEHSSGLQDGDQMLYGGEAAGYVLEFGNGLVLYAAGDTNVFGDMQLIRDLYHPQVAVLPIGDFYTMSPRVAAYAAKLLSPQAILPVHYGTFPALTGTPGALREELDKLGLNNIEVLGIKPGETVR